MVDTQLAQVGVKRGAKKGKKGRCCGRNFRWEGVSHNVTKYVASGGPRRHEERKERRAKARVARFARLAARRASMGR